MADDYQLGASTITSARALFNAGSIAGAYRAIRDDLNTQNAAARNAGLPPPVDADTIAWYTNAPEINDPNSTSFIHHFTRAYVSNYAQFIVSIRQRAGERQCRMDRRAPRRVIGTCNNLGRVKQNKFEESLQSGAC